MTNQPVAPRRRVHEPHLALDYDLETGLLSLTLDALVSSGSAVKTLAVILGHGKAALFLAAARRFQEPSDVRPPRTAERSDSGNPDAAEYASAGD
jgi:hypothetical protein